MKKVIGLLFLVMGLTVYYSKAWWLPAESTFNRPVSTQVNKVATQKSKTIQTKALDQDEDDYNYQKIDCKDEVGKDKVDCLAHKALDTLQEEYNDREKELKKYLNDISTENSKGVATSIVKLLYGNTAQDNTKYKETKKYIEKNEDEFLQDFHALYHDEDYK